jgi:hypothetical protein
MARALIVRSANDGYVFTVACLLARPSCTAIGPYVSDYPPTPDNAACRSIPVAALLLAAVA